MHCLGIHNLPTTIFVAVGAYLAAVATMHLMKDRGTQ